MMVSVTAPQREVLAGDGVDQPGIVEEAGDVVELVVDRDPVDGGERPSVCPGAVAVADQGGRLFPAGLFGLAGQGTVGRSEEGLVDAGDPVGDPSAGQSEATGDVPALGAGDDAEEGSLLGSGEGAAGAFEPGDPTQAIRVGSRCGHAVSLPDRRFGGQGCSIRTAPPVTGCSVSVTARSAKSVSVSDVRAEASATGSMPRAGARAARNAVP